MSFKAENVNKNLTDTELLERILETLLIIKLHFEKLTDEQITEGDVDDGNN